MLRRYQPPEVVPHGHYLLNDVHDVVHAVGYVYAGTPGQLLCPLVPGDDPIGKDHLAAVFDSHPGLSAVPACFPASITTVASP